MERWLAENWFNALSAVGVVGSLLFAAISLRSETKTRRIANLLTITQNHRELWKEFFQHPEFTRIFETAVNLGKYPVTREEEIFVNMVLLHTGSVYQAMTDELMIKQEGLRRDVCYFFSLPIPALVWDKVKLLQNDDFVEFIEACRNWK